MSKQVNCEVLKVEDNSVTLANRDGIWWLGQSTFTLPKDETLKDVNKGDIITITLKERTLK